MSLNIFTSTSKKEHKCNEFRYNHRNTANICIFCCLCVYIDRYKSSLNSLYCLKNVRNYKYKVFDIVIVTYFIDLISVVDICIYFSKILCNLFCIKHNSIISCRTMKLLLACTWNKGLHLKKKATHKRRWSLTWKSRCSFSNSVTRTQL